MKCCLAAFLCLAGTKIDGVCLCVCVLTLYIIPQEGHLSSSLLETKRKEGCLHIQTYTYNQTELKSEDIPSNSQKGATPLAPKRSPTICPYFLLDLLPPVNSFLMNLWSQLLQVFFLTS